MRALTALSLLCLALACAEPDTQRTPTVLMGEEDEESAPVFGEESETSGEDAAVPTAIRFQPPPDGGWSYRLILEASGQQRMESSADHHERDPIEQSFMLELEYTELPSQSSPDAVGGAYLMRLDALHFRNQQSGQPPRHIELSGDRLRVVSGRDQVDMDLEGAQPKEGLTPRMMLRQVFGLVVYDRNGDARSVQIRGRPRSREFLSRFPIREAIRFSRIPRPSGPIDPGEAWQASRFPPNAIGGLGFMFDVKYSLAGFREIDGIRCAWILLEAEREGEDVPSAAGFTFDRVQASVKGEAFIELESSRLRRMVLFDESRAGYKKGKDPAPILEHRLRYKGRLLIEAIEADPTRDKWADGKKRFEPV